jgi:hypothetical protein
MTTTVYSGRVTNWPLFWLANVLAVALVAMSGFPKVHLISLLVVAVVILVSNVTVTSIRTTAGPNGVVVRYGVFGIPRFRYPAERIASAEAIDVPFSKMGGWGIHWSPWRGTRMTIRSGPTLQLHLVGGRQVAISAEDPSAAAAVVNTATHPTQQPPG